MTAVGAEPDLLFDEDRHTYTLGGRIFLSVTQLIRLAGLGEDFRQVNPNVMAAARTRGRLVHMACHYIDEGALDWGTVDVGIFGYVVAYIRFVQECEAIPIAVEQKMVAPDLQFAGTPDLVCWLRGRRVIVDRKTGDHKGPAARLQTAGYKRLWEHLRPSSRIYERYGLRLFQSGRYHLFRHEDDLDETAFEWVRKDFLHIPEWVRQTYG